MLPIEFKERMKTLLGEDSEVFFAELENGAAVRSFRVNTMKLSRDEFEETCPEIDRTEVDFPKGAY